MTVLGRRRLRGARPLGVALGVSVVAALALAAPVATAATATDRAVVAPAAAAEPSVHDPVDPGDWEDAATTTWADYHAVPDAPKGWVDGSIKGSERVFKAAVVLVDYTDQDLLMTTEAGSHVFGNPQPGWKPIKREQAAQWYENYLNTPNQWNAGHTVNEYWMENSNGRFSVEMDTFGPYRLPGKVHEYGLSGYAPVTGTNSVCPAGDTCNKNLRTDGFAKWYEDQGEDIASQYDVLFWVTAGRDESASWQEMGEMKFQTKDDVPASFGPPGATQGPVLNAAGNPIPNWAATRYVPWTSWQAAAQHWPNASPWGNLPNSTQAEATGQSVFQHEMSHLLGIADNYNNPFSDPIRRTYSGHWDMLSRGTFNGPTGTHNRWRFPSTGASGMGSNFSLRNKQVLKMVHPSQVVDVSTADLSTKGLLSATVSARSVNRPDRLAGIMVGLSGGDKSSCTADGHTGTKAYLCDRGGYNDYMIEVVDQMGSDSFAPSSGVHVAKTKERDAAPFIWTVDANESDINWTDFIRPDGSKAAVTLGDPRQVNDALFRAGTKSGSQFERVDKANGVHLYVLKRARDAQGILTYDVAVRPLSDTSGLARGVALGSPTGTIAERGTTLSVNVPLKNTGAAGDGRYDSDVYRIEAKVDGAGWSLSQPYAVVGAKAGETVQVPLHLLERAGGKGTVTVTATSESDPSKTQTITLDVQTLIITTGIELVASLYADGKITRDVADPITAWLTAIQAHLSTGKDKSKQIDILLDKIEERAGRAGPEEAAAIREIVALLRT